MSWDWLIKLLAALVPLGALLLAGVSQWLTYSERIHAHREHLWCEQLNVARDLHVAASRVLSELQHLETDRGCDTRQPAARAEARQFSDLIEAQNQLTSALRQAMVVLPEAALSKANAFKNKLEELFALPESLDEPVFDQMWLPYLALLYELRQALGVEALSQSTAKAIR